MALDLGTEDGCWAGRDEDGVGCQAVLDLETEGRCCAGLGEGSVGCQAGLDLEEQMMVNWGVRL